MLIKPGWVKRAEILVEEEDLRERIKRAQKGDKNGGRFKESKNKVIKR